MTKTFSEVNEAHPVCSHKPYPPSPSGTCDGGWGISDGLNVGTCSRVYMKCVNMGSQLELVGGGCLDVALDGAAKRHKPEKGARCA